MNPKFWKNKRVLITGHTGFKGSWMSLWLQKLEAKIIGYSLPPPTDPSFFEIGNLSKGMISITGDVRDLEHLKEILAKYKPEIVIHMAAQTIVRYSYSNPVETYSTNVMGTVNLLEAVRQTSSVRVILNITSDKCYENNEWLYGYRENDRMGGQDPYSSSKGCAELITSAYRSSYFSEKEFQNHGVTIGSARAGNVIGGGDWALDRLIPDIMNAIMQKRPVVIRNPNSIRPWQHVLCPLEGYFLLVEKLWEQGPEFAEGWNFGPDVKDCKPVSWIVKDLSRLWTEKIDWELDPNENPHEASYLFLDCGKSKRQIGWSPKLKLREALKLIVEWYQAYLQNYNMREFSESQISHYESMEQP